MKNGQRIQECLQLAFPKAFIQVTHPRGDDLHLAVTIKALEFQGKSRVQSHQMVYRALGDLMDTTLHALSVTTEALTS